MPPPPAAAVGRHQDHVPHREPPESPAAYCGYGAGIGVRRPVVRVELENLVPEELAPCACSISHCHVMQIRR